MYTRAPLLSLGLVVAAAAGCGSDSERSDAATSDASTTDATVQASTFERIRAQVFVPSCVASACHSASGRAGTMILDGADAYDQIVGVAPNNPAAASDGMRRVAPGDPDHSFLYLKVSDGLASGMGQSMPPTGIALDQRTRTLIHAWIAAGAPRTGLIAADDGGPIGGVADEGSSGTDLAPPVHGVQLMVTAPPIPAGQAENTTCEYFKLPSDVDLDVDRFQIAVSGGSHHIHIYRPFDPTFTAPDHTETCNMAVDFDRWELVVASQLPHTDWELPEHVAFHFHAHEQLMMQTHFVNTGALHTMGEGHVTANLNAAADGSVTMYAGAIFGQDRDIAVPPHATSTTDADCVFPHDATLIALTGHYHFRGVRFTVDRLDDGHTPGAQIYESTGYNDPVFTNYGQNAPQFTTGQGLRFTCEYQNPTDTTFMFGPYTETNEHCNLFGFYYPAQTRNEALYCVRRNGVSQSTLHTSQ